MQDTDFAHAEPEELWPSHLPNNFKKKVAFYGGGYTRTLIEDHPLVDDDCEIWGGNHVWKEDFSDVYPRLTRVFDIHEIEILESYPSEKDQKHFKWLQEKHHFPIYMQNPDERFPYAVTYPYEEVSKFIFKNNYRGAEEKRAFGSMVDFMAGLAAYEGYDWIGYFGVEMSSSTEYRYQIPDGHFHIGFLAGQGITVWTPDDPRCNILRREVYAYEGYQMISRQTLEKHYYDYERQRRKWVDAANTWVGGYRLLTGQIEELRENGGEITDELAEQAIEVGRKMREARDAAALATGCMLATKAYIQHLDLEEPDLEIYPGLFDEIKLEEKRP